MSSVIKNAQVLSSTFGQYCNQEFCAARSSTPTILSGCGGFITPAASRSSMRSPLSVQHLGPIHCMDGTSDVLAIHPAQLNPTSCPITPGASPATVLQSINLSSTPTISASGRWSSLHDPNGTATGDADDEACFDMSYRSSGLFSATSCCCSAVLGLQRYVVKGVASPFSDYNISTTTVTEFVGGHVSRTADSWAVGVYEPLTAAQSLELDHQSVACSRNLISAVRNTLNLDATRFDEMTKAALTDPLGAGEVGAADAATFIQSDLNRMGYAEMDDYENDYRIRMAILGDSDAVSMKAMLFAPINSIYRESKGNDGVTDEYALIVAMHVIYAFLEACATNPCIPRTTLWASCLLRETAYAADDTPHLLTSYIHTIFEDAGVAFPDPATIETILGVSVTPTCSISPEDYLALAALAARRFDTDSEAAKFTKCVRFYCRVVAAHSIAPASSAAAIFLGVVLGVIDREFALSNVRFGIYTICEVLYTAPNMPSDLYINGVRDDLSAAIVTGRWPRAVSEVRVAVGTGFVGDNRYLPPSGATTPPLACFPVHTALALPATIAQISPHNTLFDRRLHHSEAPYLLDSGAAPSQGLYARRESDEFGRGRCSRCGTALPVMQTWAPVMQERSSGFETVGLLDSARAGAGDRPSVLFQPTNRPACLTTNLPLMAPPMVIVCPACSLEMMPEPGPRSLAAHATISLNSRPCVTENGLPPILNLPSDLCNDASLFWAELAAADNTQDIVNDVDLQPQPLGTNSLSTIDCRVLVVGKSSLSSTRTTGSGNSPCLPCDTSLEQF